MNTHHREDRWRGCCVLGNDEKSWPFGEMQEKTLNCRCLEQWFIQGEKGWIAWKQIVKSWGMVDTPYVIVGLTVQIQWEIDMKDNASTEHGEEKNICGWDSIEKRTWWDKAGRWQCSEHYFLKLNRKKKKKLNRKRCANFRREIGNNNGNYARRLGKLPGSISECWLL